MMRRAFPLLAGAALLTGCTSMAPDREIPRLAAELPAEFPDTISGDYRPASWWRTYQDPVLDGLIDRALADNLDIAQAAARIERARAQARISRAALLPQLNGSASGSFSSTPLDGSAFGGLGGNGGGGGPDRIENETYALSLGASYELDLFGSARGDLAAARADLRATIFDFRAVQLAAAAETLATYFELVDARRQIELTLESADLLAERADRTEDRYRRGLADSLTLYQVRQDLRATQASLPQREKLLADTTARLALLVRTVPERVEADLATTLQPQLDLAEVPPGLPLDLLEQRPDVAAAAARLEASRQRIGARKADRFPSLSFSVTPGTQSARPEGALDIINNWALSLLASVTAPLFDGGRISARIEAERATYDEAAAAYAQAVLRAYGEVTSALEAYEEDRQRYRLIAAQRDEAAFSADTRARQFSAGVGAYTAYLDAERARLQTEASLSGAALDVVRSRLAVHRALGGDWFVADIAPRPVEMTPATTADTVFEDPPS